MHFVICMFTSLVIFAVSVLFVEIFPKWFKALLTLGASYTTGYAAMILIRKIAELSKAYTKPKLFPGVWIAAAISLVVIVLVKIYLAKTKTKREEKRAAKREVNLAKWAKEDEENAKKEAQAQKAADEKAKLKAQKKAAAKREKEAKKAEKKAK